MNQLSKILETTKETVKKSIAYRQISSLEEDFEKYNKRPFLNSISDGYLYGTKSWGLNFFDFIQLKSPEFNVFNFLKLLPSYSFFFAILPIDVNREKRGNIVEGVDPGAPENPKITKKIIYCTLITSGIFIVIYLLVINEILNLRNFLN